MYGPSWARHYASTPAPLSSSSRTANSVSSQLNDLEANALSSSSSSHGVASDGIAARRSRALLINANRRYRRHSNNHDIDQHGGKGTRKQWSLTCGVPSVIVIGIIILVIIILLMMILVIIPPSSMQSQPSSSDAHSLIGYAIIYCHRRTYLNDTITTLRSSSNSVHGNDIHVFSMCGDVAATRDEWTRLRGRTSSSVSSLSSSSGVQWHMMDQHHGLDMAHMLIRDSMPAVRDSYRLWNTYNRVYHAMFDTYNYTNVVILEDDLKVSSYIHQYFTWTANVLARDSSIFCASAWNDLAIESSSSLWIQRGHHFPGLGFMINDRAWHHLRTAMIPMESYDHNGDIMPVIYNATRAAWQFTSLTALDLLSSHAWDSMIERMMMHYHMDCITPSTSLSHHQRSDIMMTTPSAIQDIFDMMPLWNDEHTSLSYGHIDDLLISSYSHRMMTIISDHHTIRHCIAAMADNDERWDHIMTSMSRLGRGMVGNQRGVYDGIVLVTWQHKQHAIIARYSSLFNTLCSHE